MPTKDQAASRPTTTYDDGTYLAANPGWHEEDGPYKSRLVIDAVSRNQIAFRTCADVGCGAGVVTERLGRQYPEARFVGYDLSADAARFWERRSRTPNVEYRNLSVLEGPERYDLVVCLDVFEHVEDYYGFLRALRARGAQFVFNVPLDMSVMKLLTPGLRYVREEVGHLHYFNHYTARKVLEDTGYDILEARLSAAFVHTPPRSLRQAAVLPIRLASLALGKKAASLMWGGLSLVVTARARA
jgi:SAM-dependent methyltransferase